MIRAISAAERHSGPAGGFECSSAGRGRMRSRTLALGCLLIGGVLALDRRRATVVARQRRRRRPDVQRDPSHGWIEPSTCHRRAAGTILMLALRPRGRRVIGALLVLVGVDRRGGWIGCAQRRRHQQPGT